MRSMHCGRSCSSNVKSFSSLMMLFCRSVIRNRMLSRPTLTPAKQMAELASPKTLGRRPPGVSTLPRSETMFSSTSSCTSLVMVGTLMCSSLVSSESVHSPLMAMCAMMLRLIRLFLWEMPLRVSSSCLLKNSVSDVILCMFCCERCKYNELFQKRRLFLINFNNLRPTRPHIKRKTSVAKSSFRCVRRLPTASISIRRPLRRRPCG